jgi:membrane-bound serine protease (ClpP class)
VVDPFVADYLERGIADAAAAGNEAVLIQIDTPGGLDSSMRQVTEAILAAEIPVIGYVAPSGARAASAGAFVLMSTPVAAMAPGTNVGAATPVGINGATGSDKAVQDAAASMRSLAEHQGRNAVLATSFVTDAVSISAEQALADGVIDYIAPSAEELLESVDGRTVEIDDTTVTLHTAGDAIVDEGLGGFVGFLHGLLDPNLAFIFFWVGLALIVLELLVPGHIFSGTLGTILLVLAVISFGLLPVRILGVALLLGAAVAFIVEASQPGLGIWGVLGLVFLVLGGWFLYDRAGGAGVSPWVIASIAVVIGLFFGLVVAKARKLRDLPPPQGPESIVGEEGVALGSGLDPSGVVRINAEQWQAVTTGRRIPAGARIRATAIEGFTLTVEPVEPARTAEAVHPSGTTPVSDASSAPTPVDERGTS